VRSVTSIRSASSAQVHDGRADSGDILITDADGNSDIRHGLRHRLR
jgi:hypothetical protein